MTMPNTRLDASNGFLDPWDIEQHKIVSENASEDKINVSTKTHGWRIHAQPRKINND